MDEDAIIHANGTNLRKTLKNYDTLCNGCSLAGA
jgi:hypothetical protein